MNKIFVVEVERKAKQKFGWSIENAAVFQLLHCFDKKIVPICRQMDRSLFKERENCIFLLDSSFGEHFNEIVSKCLTAKSAVIAMLQVCGSSFMKKYPPMSEERTEKNFQNVQFHLDTAPVLCVCQPKIGKMHTAPSPLIARQVLSRACDADLWWLFDASF